MTVEQVFAGDGSGDFGFRLLIEGWPCTFVSDERITFATYADGREVVAGLQYQGLVIHDRVVMQEASLQTNGITFRIVPREPRYDTAGRESDRATYYLSQERKPLDRLDASIDHDDTALTWKSGSTYANGQVLHIGTEAIRSNGDGTFDRHIWDTQEQAHPLTAFGDEIEVYAYGDVPPTMEGRRVTLCMYGEGDDLAGDGGIVWRGIVSHVPSMDADCKTWLIQCQGISHILNQDIAANLSDAHPIGIYHHFACPFWIAIHVDFTAYGPYFYVGHAMNEAELFGEINTLLAQALVNAGIDDLFDSFKIEKKLGGSGGFLLQAVRSSDSTASAINVTGGSMIMGLCSTKRDNWKVAVQSSSSDLGQSPIDLLDALSANLDTDGTYYVELTHQDPRIIVDTGYTYEGAPVSPLGPTNVLTSIPHIADARPASITNFPQYRIYLDRDLGDADAIYIPGTFKPDGLFRILDTGTDGGKNYVDIVGERGVHDFGVLGGAAVGTLSSVSLFLGFLSGDVTITALRNYALGGIGEFVTELKLKARQFANSGDTPFVTDADLGNFEADPSLVSPLARARVYSFASKIRLRTLLEEELKFNNAFMRIGADATIELALLPRWTDATPVPATHEIGADDILSPPSPGASYPKCTPNSNGRITEIEVRHYYSSVRKEHIDRPVVVHETTTIPVTKQRGKSPHRITPFSSPFLYPHFANEAFMAEIAKVSLAFFSGTYMTVTICVPYTKFRIYCGDIVSLTDERVPDGEGGKGVTDRRGVVIERAWYMDPGMPARGEITVMLTGALQSGYCPSAYPSLVDNTSGDTWVLTCDSVAEPINTALSHDGDGKVLQHFAVGDFVRIYEIDSYTPTEVLGVVDAVDADADEITVTFDSTWSPTIVEGGVTGWILAFQRDNDDGDFSTENQRKYTYVSRIAGTVNGGGFAKRFS